MTGPTNFGWQIYHRYADRWIFYDKRSFPVAEDPSRAASPVRDSYTRDGMTETSSFCFFRLAFERLFKLPNGAAHDR